MDKTRLHHVDVERYLLGAALLDEKIHGGFFAKLNEADFFREAHRLIFQAMKQIYKRGDPVDLMTVTTELQKMDSLDQAGGAHKIAEIAGMIPSSTNWEHHAEIVGQAAGLRTARNILTEATNAAESLTGPDLDKLILDVKTMLDTVEYDRRPRYRRLAEIYDGLPGNFYDLSKKSIWPTGHQWFDSHMIVQKGDYVVIGGRPSNGKTDIALWWARHIQAYTPVLFYSLEGNIQKVAARIAVGAGSGGKQSDRYKTGLEASAQYKIFIEHCPGLRIEQMIARSREAIRKEGIGAIFVDYLQKMRGPGKTTYDRVSHISEELAVLAGDAQVPVIALAQLGRASVESATKRPGLHHLKESGGIEQDADFVANVHYPIKVGCDHSVYADDCKDKSLFSNYYEINFAKCKEGPTGIEKVYYEPALKVFDGWKNPSVQMT